MLNNIDNDQPIIYNAAMSSPTAAQRRKRKRPLNSSPICNNVVTNFSMYKVTAVTAACACAILFCTKSSSCLDVLAHSDSRTVGTAASNLVDNSGQHQIQHLKLSTFRGDEVPHSNSRNNIQNFFLVGIMSAKSLHHDNNSDAPNDKNRILQRREEYGYGAYGVPPSQNTESTMNTNANSDTNNNNYDASNSESKGWFGKKKTDENVDTGGDMVSNTNNNGNTYNSASGGGYGSYYGNNNGASSPSYSSSSSSSTSTGAYGSYNGSTSSESSRTASNSGGYGSYGSSSTSAYGDSSSSPRSSSYYGGGSSYSSTWGADSASSSSKWGSSSSSSSTGLRGGKGLHPVKIDLLKAIFFLLLISSSGMLLTAHVMENDPEGTFANCCRVSLHTVNCVYSIIYNLYHCRLGEIPGILCGSELDEDEYTEEELERMTLRPGIERALDTEHRKALRKVGVEMNMIKPKMNGSSGRNSRGDRSRSSKGVHNGENI